MTDTGPAARVATWLRIPGMLCSAEMFTVLDPYLHLPGRALDVSLVADNLDDAADRLLASAATVTGPVGVLALSLGAVVTLAAAIRRPDAFSALALMSINARAPRPDQLQSWARQAERTRAGGFTEVAEEQLPTLFAPAAASNGSLAVARRMAQSVGPAGLLSQLGIQQTRWDLRERLGQIRAATLVIAGGRDQLCPVATHEEVSTGIPDAELVVLESLGHLPTLEDPAQTAEVINDWSDRTVQ